MQQTHSIRAKLIQFLVIVFPILITQISLAASGFCDTVMSGQASPEDLAGVAVGANIWMPAFTGINGIFIGTTSILAYLHGARRKQDMVFTVVQGIYLSIALALVLLASGWFFLTPLLNTMNLDPAVHRIAYEFLQAIALGIFPLFASSVLRNFIDSLGYTRVTMIITLCAVPINIAVNYLLIFGQLGFPRLGGVGAGYGSAVTYWCIFIGTLLVVYFAPPFRDYPIFRRVYPLSLKAWKEQLLLGIPIGSAIFCEVSIFAAVALFMAEFGTAVIAAHQAAMNFAGLVYMVPLSIGMALTIVVGFETGARRYRDARIYSYLGVGIALSIGSLTAAGLFLLNRQVAGLYTNDPDLLPVIQRFLLYAIFFQLSDATAAPIQGALRGYKDVRITLIMAIISYWAIGLPAGYILSGYADLGPYGYWIGLILGLAVGAAALSFRLIRLQRRCETAR